MNIKIFLGRVFNFRNVKTAALALAGIAVFLFAVGYGLSWYGEWSFSRDIKRLTEEANRPYLEDAYGGKTPKETLELFIAAVEKEDFDLASKYFVISKQEEWRNGLEKVREKSNLNWFLNELKKNNSTLDYTDPTEMLGNRQLYTVGDTMVMTFIKYPRGIWKIQEI